MQTVAGRLPGLRPNWAQLSKERAPLAFALDYDGTLVPRPTDPADSITPPAIVDALSRLAQQRPVAIVTGRDASDVAERIGLPELYYAGCHGMQVRGPDLDEEAPPHHADAIADAGARLDEQFASTDQVIVERKRYAVSVHVRRVPPGQRLDVTHVVRRIAADVTGLVLTAGDAMVEVRADAPFDKGTALMTLRRHWDAKHGIEHAVLFAGDDETDEDGLRILADNPRDIGIVVGRPPRSTHATYVLEDVDDVAAWLSET